MRCVYQIAMSVCYSGTKGTVPSSSMLFINQLPRFCGQFEISNSFGRFGEIEAVYLCPGRGCVLLWPGH